MEAASLPIAVPMDTIEVITEIEEAMALASVGLAWVGLAWVAPDLVGLDVLAGRACRSTLQSSRLMQP